MTRTLDRRRLLGSAAGLVSAAGLAALAGACSGPRREDRPDRPGRSVPPRGIGMQLYTMRSVLADDFAGTLEALAAIGYATVGVGDRFGRSARQVRRLLDDSGLRAVVQHVGYDGLTGDWPAVVDDALTLGCRWVAIPSLPASLHSPGGYRKAAAAFSRGGRTAREAGLGLLFHNHAGDFDTVGGEVLYDILLRETEPHLVGFELDLYWCVKAAKDPVDYLTRYPGRFPVLHVKDMARDGSFADVGSGVLDFEAMFAHADRGGVRQWLVEHDRPADPFATARNSYRALSRMRF